MSRPLLALLLAALLLAAAAAAIDSKSLGEATADAVAASSDTIKDTASKSDSIGAGNNEDARPADVAEDNGAGTNGAGGDSPSSSASGPPVLHLGRWLLGAIIMGAGVAAPLAWMAMKNRKSLGLGTGRMD